MAPQELVNKAPYLMIIPLNDGTSVHLAPGKKTTVQPYQVAGNTKLKKLQAAGLVAVVEGGAKEKSKAAEEAAEKTAEKEEEKPKTKGK